MDGFDIALISIVVLVGLGFLLLEWRLRSLRTSVLELPGSLRFEAQEFSVQIQKVEKEIRVSCERGVWKPSAAAATRNPAHTGRGSYQFAANGYRVAVRESVRQLDKQAAPVRLGYSEIEMRGGDGSALLIERVPHPVANSFDRFARQVRLWVERLEHRQERERVEQLQREAETAQAERDASLLARLLADKPAGAAVTQPDAKANAKAQADGSPEASAGAGAETSTDVNAIANAQIEQWRKESGFKGANSQFGLDARGVVSWFIDLATDGRITLHANRVTLHTTLHGAVFTVLGGEMEITVRCAHWSPELPTTKTFRVLRGTSLDERRAWKERLELIRDGLT